MYNAPAEALLLHTECSAQCGGHTHPTCAFPSLPPPPQLLKYHMVLELLPLQQGSKFWHEGLKFYQAKTLQSLNIVQVGAAPGCGCCVQLLGQYYCS